MADFLDRLGEQLAQAESNARRQALGRGSRGGVRGLSVVLAGALALAAVLGLTRFVLGPSQGSHPQRGGAPARIAVVRASHGQASRLDLRRMIDSAARAAGSGPGAVNISQAESKLHRVLTAIAGPSADLASLWRRGARAGRGGRAGIGALCAAPPSIRVAEPSTRSGASRPPRRTAPRDTRASCGNAHELLERGITRRVGTTLIGPVPRGVDRPGP